jgi:hypothetical protein
VKVAKIKWGDKHLKRLLFDMTTLACSGKQGIGGVTSAALGSGER